MPSLAPSLVRNLSGIDPSESRIPVPLRSLADDLEAAQPAFGPGDESAQFCLLVAAESLALAAIGMIVNLTWRDWVATELAIGIALFAVVLACGNLVAANVGRWYSAAKHFMTPGRNGQLRIASMGAPSQR